ncbi:hypothetical protein UK30_10020 [Salmonella enterica]|nr:hypothetical protein [Salmonella enterica]
MTKPRSQPSRSSVSGAMDWEGLYRISGAPIIPQDLPTDFTKLANELAKVGLTNIGLNAIIKNANKLKSNLPRGGRFAISVGSCFATGEGLQTHKDHGVYCDKLASVCYESQLFTAEFVAEINRENPLVIHQSLAPCERCRCSYSQLAKQQKRTIIVLSDSSTDGAATVRAKPVYLIFGNGLIYRMQ